MFAKKLGFYVCRVAYLIASTSLYGENVPRSFTVHVLINKKPLHDSGHLWTIKCQDGYMINGLSSLDFKNKMHAKLCKIHIKKGTLFVGKRETLMQKICIRPHDGNLVVDGKQYQGCLCVLHHEGVWYLVNSVDLEDYVCSVLRSESWPGWSLEVNKAFAIVQRSYVVSKVVRARQNIKKGKVFLFDIGCTNLDQTYQGVHECSLLKQATAETAGVVLAYKKKPIVAMYDTCCGGLVPSKMKEINAKEFPYLARAYPCTSCATCKIYNWKATYTQKEAANLLNTVVDTHIKKIDDMKVTLRDEAGIVLCVKVKSGGRWISFSRSQIYSLFKDIKSFSFSVQAGEKNIVFTGRGYGHNKGMCQWGANAMVDNGWDYKSVLKFYYPDTTFMKLKVA